MAVAQNSLKWRPSYAVGVLASLREQGKSQKMSLIQTLTALTKCDALGWDFYSSDRGVRCYYRLHYDRSPLEVDWWHNHCRRQEPVRDVKGPDDPTDRWQRTDGHQDAWMSEEAVRP